MCHISDRAAAAIMKRGRIFEVGGAVRDRLLNLPIKERDYLVAGIPFQELSALLEDFGKVDLVGRSFGVIKFTQTHGGDRFTFDIALPRLEFSTGVGHKDFEVSFDPYIRVEEDLVRRDFTINAMAMPLDGGELIDPLGGREDLGNKIIRMTSPTSFEEDPLRMLRAVRFAARFQFEIEPKTLQSIKDHAPLIDSVSVERIAEELNKTLLQPEKPSRGVRLMQSTGLLKQILPELEATVGVEQPGGYHAYDVFEHTARAIDESPPSLRIRLAAMFHDIAKPQAKQLTEDGATFYGHETTGARRAAKIMRRLRYSNELAQEVTTLVERHMFTVPSTDKGLRRLIRRVTPELIYDLLELRRADIIAQGRGGTTDDVDEFEKRIRDEIAKKPPFGVKDLALNGRDIMELFNIPESPLVGEVLDFLLEKALDDPQDNRREKLTEFARSYLGNKKISKDKDKVIGET